MFISAFKVHCAERSAYSSFTQLDTFLVPTSNLVNFSSESWIFRCVSSCLLLSWRSLLKILDLNFYKLHNKKWMHTAPSWYESIFHLQLWIFAVCPLAHLSSWCSLCQFLFTQYRVDLKRNPTGFDSCSQCYENVASNVPMWCEGSHWNQLRCWLR